MRIFVINPGSTSTKFALYHGEELVWKETLHHTAAELARFMHINDQLSYRTNLMMETIRRAGIDEHFDAVIGRGGLVKPTPGGVYLVDSKLKHDLLNASMEHACNLGGLMADKLASPCKALPLIADPEVVDELMDEARLSGLPSMDRHSVFHALNSKAVARMYAQSIGKRYEDINLIIAHLGGGISVGAHRHGKVVDVNNALNGDGPFSPERAGTVPADSLVELCYSGRYSLRQVKSLLNGSGGLTAHLGTNDVSKIVERAEKGEQPYKRVLDSMLYNVAKEIGARSVALRGKVDAIILTGGIAHSNYCTDKIIEWAGFIAPVEIRAGEDEMRALAMNALGALKGTAEILRYNP